MSKYKLINSTTKEEHLCDKITIDGFDYYTTKFINKVNTYINEYGKPIVKYKKDLNDDLIWESLNGKSSACDSKYEFKTIIATNNPNINIPKVVDEVEKLSVNSAKTFWFEEPLLVEELKEKNDFINGFIEGYSKSQETHSYTETDIEFIVKETLDDAMKSVIWSEYYYKHLSKELINKLKEEKNKTIYYQ